MTRVTDARAPSGDAAHRVDLSTDDSATPDGDGTVVRRDVVRNRAKILTAADDLVAQRGLDISLNDLAHHAGVGVATVYRHFADRDALLKALVEDRVELLVALLADAAAHPDPGEALYAAMSGICEHQAADRGVFHAATTAQDEHGALVRERLEPYVEAIVTRARDAGIVRPDLDVADVPVALWMIGSLAAADAGRPDIWRRYLAIVLDGMTATAARALPVPAISPERLPDLFGHPRPIPRAGTRQP